MKIQTRISQNSIFMSNNAPGGTKKHIAKVLNPKVTKMFSSSSSSTSSSKGLFKIVWLYHFTQSSSILHWGMHQHFAYSQLWSLTKHLNQSLRNCGFIYNTIFFTCTVAHKSLCNKRNLIISQDWWIRNTVVCIKTGRVIVDSVFELSLVNGSSANTTDIYGGSLWGKLQLK